MTSKLYKSILTCLNSKELTEPFRVNDVNNCDCCKGLLRNSPSFLSKHRKGNPGGYTEYFERIKDKNGNEIKGLYNLITE